MRPRWTTPLTTAITVVLMSTPAAATARIHIERAADSSYNVTVPSGEVLKAKNALELRDILERPIVQHHLPDGLHLEFSGITKLHAQGIDLQTVYRRNQLNLDPNRLKTLEENLRILEAEKRLKLAFENSRFFMSKSNEPKYVGVERLDLIDQGKQMISGRLASSHSFKAKIFITLENGVKVIVTIILDIVDFADNVMGSNIQPLIRSAVRRNAKFIDWSVNPHLRSIFESYIEADIRIALRAKFPNSRLVKVQVEDTVIVLESRIINRLA